MMSRIREIFHNELTLGSDKWDPYFDVYENYCSKYINKPITLVEIGVQSGGSIQMWRKFLGPEAKIIGVDVDPAVMNHKPFYDENIDIVIGDQESHEFWDSFLQKYPEIDVLIDDGGHTMQQQIVTFERVFPHIKKDGVLICEDTHTSYYRSFGSSLYDRNSFIEYSKRISDLINYQHIDSSDRRNIDHKLLSICNDLTGVCFHDSMVVFLKNGKKPFNRLLVNK
jgi:23S rRNA U2552 (ribose-2'-O)-methylase RlmE/FtsJ